MEPSSGKLGSAVKPYIKTKIPEDDGELPQKVFLSKELRSLKLHRLRCRGREEDVAKMQLFLDADPEALNRPQRLFIRHRLPLPGYVNHQNRFPPIYDAVEACHVKCLKFFLEKGADLSICSNFSLLDFAVHKITLQFDRFGPDRGHLFLESILQHDVLSLIPDDKDYIQHTGITNAVYVHDPVIFNLLGKYGAFFHPKINTKILLNYLSHLFGEGLLFKAKLLLKYSNFTEEPNKISISREMMFFFSHITERFYRHGDHGNNEQISAEDYASVVCEVLSMLKQFGFNMYQIIQSQGASDKALKAFVENRVPQEVKTQEMQEKLNEIFNNPLSLQSSCRTVFHRQIERNFYCDVIDTLEIPENCKSFLQFEDVTFTKNKVWFNE